MKQYDFAIVGGGFSGLYASYRIIQRNPKTSIALFEKSNRLGGRIYTKHEGNLVQEYGPMRFELQLQPNFNKLLKELDIQTKPFAGYTAQPDRMPDFNKLTFAEVQAIHTNQKRLPPAFALLKHALQDILEDQWDIESDNLSNPVIRDMQKRWLLNHGTFQGRPLHKHGLWDTLAHVLSKEAIDYIREDGTFYHMIHTNPNAANHILFILDMLVTQPHGLVTINGGTHQLIDSLYQRICPHVTVNMNERIDVFDAVTNNEGNIDLFLNTHHGSHPSLEPDSGNYDMVQCKHLIFTCPKRALQHVRGFDPSVYTHLNSVITVKLFKIFIVIENPAWDESNIPLPNTNAHLVPCREVHYDYDPVAKRGQIMIYGDEPSLNYWSSFCTGWDMTTPEVNNNPHLLNHLYHYIRILFPNHKNNMVIHRYAIMDWSREPNGCGVHMWRPGFQSEHIIDKLICTGPHKNVHIVGEAYSGYQGFLEGCITSVDNLLQHINSY